MRRSSRSTGGSPRKGSAMSSELPPEPARLLDGFDIRALQPETIQAIINDLRGSATRPRRAYASLVTTLETHLAERREAAQARERAMHAARLQRQEEAERLRVVEQEAANTAVAEVRRRFAQKWGLVR
jgi:hypothetical protein